MAPTPNKTEKATASDSVMTPPNIAQLIVDHFKPVGRILEPAKGTGNFLNALPPLTEWCEITEERDFFEYEERVDWIITNPPYSIYDRFLEHCFEVADNVVLLVPVQKAFKSMKNQRLVDSYGGLKEVYIIGGGVRADSPSVSSPAVSTTNVAIPDLYTGYLHNQAACDTIELLAISNKHVWQVFSKRHWLLNQLKGLRNQSTKSM